MKLTPLHIALLKRLQRYRETPPTLRERLRLMSGFMMILLLPVALLGYLTVRLQLPGGLLFLAGLYVGVVAREIGQQRRFVSFWSLNREITHWDHVDQLLSGTKELLPAVNPVPMRKVRIGYAVTVGATFFALAFGGAIAAERALAYIYNPTRNNPARNVIVLSASWCGYCNTLRQHLTELEVPYTDLDTEHTTEGRWAFSAVHGRGIPITIVGDQVIRGLGKKPARWESLDNALRHAGYALSPPGTPND
jgi:glutaredoxin